MARLFGTDGVRGIANEELTPLMAMQLLDRRLPRMLCILAMTGDNLSCSATRKKQTPYKKTQRIPIGSAA